MARTILRALRPGMIHQLGALDLGEMRPDYDKMYPSSCSDSNSKLPKKKVYPSIFVDSLNAPIDLPDSGEGKVVFRVRRRESRTDEGGTTKHGVTIEIRSISAPDDDEKKKLPGTAKLVVAKELGALRPGMISLDDRPRNGNGQFEPQAEGGPTPNTMAAAYGGVQAEKVVRRRSLLARLGIGAQPDPARVLP